MDAQSFMTWRGASPQAKLCTLLRKWPHCGQLDSSGLLIVGLLIEGSYLQES